MTESAFKTVRATLRFMIVGMIASAAIALCLALLFLDHARPRVAEHFFIALLGAVPGALVGALAGSYRDARRQQGRFQVMLFLSLICVVILLVGLGFLVILANQPERHA